MTADLRRLAEQAKHVYVPRSAYQRAANPQAILALLDQVDDLLEMAAGDRRRVAALEEGLRALLLPMEDEWQRGIVGNQTRREGYRAMDKARALLAAAPSEPCPVCPIDGPHYHRGDDEVVRPAALPAEGGEGPGPWVDVAGLDGDDEDVPLTENNRASQRGER